MNLCSEIQKSYIEMMRNMNHSDSEIEMAARLLRGYDRFCIRNGIPYVEDMTDAEFDEFALFLSGRSPIVASSDAKLLKIYFSFLQTARYIPSDVYKNRIEKINSIVQTNSRSKFKKPSDFTASGKDLVRFFYVSPEHFVNDVAAISPGRDYNSSIVIMILAWSGLTSVDVANLTESQVSSDCSTIHVDNGNVEIPSVMQQIVRDYRESETEFSLPVSGDSAIKIMESSLFIKKRKSGPRGSTERKYKVNDTITDAIIRQRARDFSKAVSDYHNIPFSLNFRKMNTFARLYDLDKQIVSTGQGIISYVETLELGRDEESHLIRLLTERKAFIDTNESVKSFLQY